VTIADDRGYYIQPLKDSDESSSWRETHGSKKRQNNRKDLNTVSPVSSEGSSKVVSIPSLHGSLLKVHQKRDPLRYFEVVKVLGDGSMGSVSKVIKRESAKGGSARKHFVRREKQHEWCFGIFDPDNCGKFNIFCPIKDEDDHESFASDLETPGKSSSKSTDSVSSGGDEHQRRNGGKKLTGEARAKLFAKHKTSSLITYDIKDSFYALKSIHLDQCRDDVFRLELLNEISILQRLDHPHIVKALETFNFKDRLYVVLELCSGGDLYTRDPYTETQACSIIHDILDAVAYMHSRGITHRDLKFENIMFSSPDLDAVKVIDFGLSKKYSQKEHLHDTVGTYKRGVD
jgi:serine/threonine protein kinase